MRDLIDDVFVAAFDNPLLAPLEDQARVPMPTLARHGDRLAFTTDSFVVDPLFFPGGDIGKLAVCGTINDLAVGGAIPLYLSCARDHRGRPAVRRAAPRSPDRWPRRRATLACRWSPATPRSCSAAPATSCSSPPPASA